MTNNECFVWASGENECTHDLVRKCINQLLIHGRPITYDEINVWFSGIDNPLIRDVLNCHPENDIDLYMAIANSILCEPAISVETFVAIKEMDYELAKLADLVQFIRSRVIDIKRQTCPVNYSLRIDTND